MGSGGTVPRRGAGTAHGVLMTKLDDDTWRRPATEGERQRRVGRSGQKREATGGTAPLSPSCGMVSSTTDWRRGASNGAAQIGIEAASDTVLRTGDFYTGKQLQDAAAQLSQSG
jgi:hypothetical protein